MHFKYIYTLCITYSSILYFDIFITLAKSISVKLGVFAGEYYSRTELKKKSVELCVLLCAPHFIITITEKKA